MDTTKKMRLNSEGEMYRYSKAKLITGKYITLCITEKYILYFVMTQNEYPKLVNE